MRESAERLMPDLSGMEGMEGVDMSMIEKNMEDQLKTQVDMARSQMPQGQICVPEKWCGSEIPGHEEFRTGIMVNCGGDSTHMTD